MPSFERRINFQRIFQFDSDKKLRLAYAQQICLEENVIVERIQNNPPASHFIFAIPLSVSGAEPISFILHEKAA